MLMTPIGCKCRMLFGKWLAKNSSLKSDHERGRFKAEKNTIEIYVIRLQICGAILTIFFQNVSSPAESRKIKQLYEGCLASRCKSDCDIGLSHRLQMLKSISAISFRILFVTLHVKMLFLKFYTETRSKVSKRKQWWSRLSIASILNYTGVFSEHCSAYCLPRNTQL